MKYFLAFSLLAFVAGLRADEFEDLFLDDEIDGGDPDRHPYVVRAYFPVDRSNA